jgi:hypothetical protein
VIERAILAHEASTSLLREVDRLALDAPDPDEGERA